MAVHNGGSVEVTELVVAYGGGRGLPTLLLPGATDTHLYASDTHTLPTRVDLQWRTPDGERHQQTVEVAKDMVPKGSRLVMVRLELGTDNRWEVSVDRVR